jgi:phosphinothricin acetyltransferase
MKLIRCTPAQHQDTILAILNDAIVHSTALYDYKPRTPEAMTQWFATKSAAGFPVIGVEDDTGTLLGFASYGTFRAWPAYKYTAEHSIYIHKDHRGRGLGKWLLGELIEAARKQDLHTLIGAIDGANASSVALHRQFGFEPVGRVREAAFKFGRWLDLEFYQLILETPKQPVDG